MVKSKLPRPVPDIKYINFGTVRTGSTQRAVVVVKNTGGVYSRYSVKASAPWIEIIGQYPQISIKTTPKEAGKIYIGYVIIQLDKEETRVKIRLRTRKIRSKSQKTGAKPSALPTPKPKRNLHLPLAGKVLVALLIIAALLAIILVPHAIWEKNEKAKEKMLTPALKNLDAWIEQNVIPSLTSRPQEWHTHWYNDKGLIGEEIWVLGGVTVTAKDYRFESANFVFYSPDRGNSWQIKWRNEDKIKIMTGRSLKIISKEKIEIMMPGMYGSMFMLSTMDKGKNWKIKRIS